MKEPLKLNHLPSGVSITSVIELVRCRIEGAIRELLEEKHLYQSTRAPLAELAGAIDAAKWFHESLLPPLPRRLPTLYGGSLPGPQESGAKSREEVAQGKLKAVLAGLYRQPWHLTKELSGSQGRPIAPTTIENEPICFLPTIRSRCAACDDAVTPHAPGYFGSTQPEPHLALNLPVKNKVVQIFAVAYQCQGGCKSEPVIYVIRREGEKLILAGRSLFPGVDVPKFIPKQLNHFYSEAVIAKAAGKYLPACLYLRLVAEHQMRSVVNLAALPARSTGDELGDAYAKRLPQDFPRNEVSLKTVFGDLSEIIHAGTENADAYERALLSINRHFDLLRLIPIQDSEEALPTTKIAPISKKKTSKPK